MPEPDKNRSIRTGCEPELIRACQAGEREARGEFYRLYRLEVTRIIARIIGPSPDLEDAVQDAFIEIFRAIRSFRGDSRVSTWLYRVCTNVALQRIRRKKRNREFLLEVPEVASELTPEREVAVREASRHVYRLLEQLSPKKRIVFVLHEIEGMDGPEIAKVVGSNPLTVRTRLHYARKEFYQLAAQDRLLDEQR